VLGADHPTTLTSRSNLAAAYARAGRLAEAVEMHQQTLADRERVLGPDHPTTLTSCHNLAAAYARSGQLRESIACYKRTLAGRKRVLGPDHPATRATRDALTRVKDQRSAALLGWRRRRLPPLAPGQPAHDRG
jgi:tetratricopeptide (TPR) repeat protein